MSETSIGELIRKIESDYTTGTTTIGKYVEFSQYENIEKIDAYLNSKHTSGLEDSLGREKPFFNIVTGAVNIWYRATDIDRKNIRIKATKKSDYIGAFLASIHLQEWMKKDGFGVFLNDWGRALARYGSAVVKFVEKGGKLHAEVVTWNRLYSDTIDFENNPKLEKLYLTPAQLRKNKAFDQDKVEQLLEALQTRETQNGQTVDSKSEYIEVYELHGELELCELTEREEDEDTYVQQMHVNSFVAREEKGANGETEYDDFCLLKGKEAKDPYMITHLIKEDGRSQSIGAVEHLFEAQWMQNYTAKAIKDQLDLASKIIFQTSDGNYISMNALTDIEVGDIMIHEKEAPLTQLNNQATDITSLQNFATQWQVLAKEITSTPDSISGGTMPSGTAYRQVAILNQEAHSLFEIMTENKGLAIEEMCRKYVLPYLMKKMDTSKEISTTLDAHGITEIDSMYVNAEAMRRYNTEVKESVMGIGGRQPMDALKVNMEDMKMDVQNELNQTGNQRFIKPSQISDKTWKQLFKDLVWDVEVEVTNEQSDKEAIMTTLTTVMQTIAMNPAVLNDPNMKMLFNKILETTGSISPLEMSNVPVKPALPANPTDATNSPQPLA